MSADKITVNGNTAHFKPCMLGLSIPSGARFPLSMYARYNDGTTSRYGVTVQEIKEAVDQGRKIVLTTKSNKTDADIYKAFVIRVDVSDYCYALYDGTEVAIYVYFDNENDHGEAEL